MRFTHLHTHSHYSLLDGLSKIDSLVDRAKALGMEAMAITDHGVLYGAIEFYKKATKAGIKPIIGCEMYITDGSRHDKRPNIDNDKRFHLIVLAKNDIGYRNLVKLVTISHLEGFYYKPRIDKEVLRQHAEGLIGLSACLAGEVSRAITAKKPDRAKEIALEYQDIFGVGNFFIELQQHLNLEDQNVVTPQLIKLARQTGIPMVATQDSHYTHKDDAYAQDILLAVQTGNKLTDTNRFSMNQDDFSVLSLAEMQEKFSTLDQEAVVEAIENTQKIADACNLTIELGKVQLPHFPLPEGQTDAFAYLEELTAQGITRRYGADASPEIAQRAQYELSVIKQTGFASYFLIVQDFVNWAKAQGIVVGPGRGSAAGSLVSYALNITNVDPIKYNLIFERFLNPERISMPDIDLDFADHRRDEVLKYVGEKYGHDHVAQVITFGTIAARGGIRDAGRVLGFSYDFCDRVAKMIPANPNSGSKEGVLQNCIETIDEVRTAYNTNPDVKKLIDAAIKLEGVARHSSTHACAVVITPKPLTEYLPLQQGTNEGDIITQYEMHAVEDLGLLKMDFLGLANLTIIENTLALIKQNKGTIVDIDAIPTNDKKAFKLLQDAKTTGVFQLESSGMKRYLKELKPTEIEDIISMVALYRPGPMDAIPDFIAAKHGRKKIRTIHPALEPVLRDSYGIIVTQDQVLQVARTFAGFSYAEADILRKAVGKKIKKLLDEQKQKFAQGAMAQGHTPVMAEQVWNFIEPFARYGFNRAHAACYAMIAYQTAYLKANYPTEFMAAFMNSETGDVERIAYLIDEAREMNIQVLAPDINESYEEFTAVTTAAKPTIRFGLSAVKNVGVNIVQSIIRERQLSGHYQDMEDFVCRIHSRDLNKKSLESLIRCGALDSFGERNILLYNTDAMLTHAREKQKHLSTGQVSLFGSATEVFLPPLRLATTEPAAKWDKLMWEKELLGLYISEHPLAEYQDTLRLEKVSSIKNALLQANNGSMKIGGVVTKTQKIVTKAGKPMLFSWIEDLTSKIEVVVFPGVLEKNPDAFKENSVIIVQGKVNDRDGTSKLLCDSVKAIAIMA